MLYIVGTKREANALRQRLPRPVFDKLLQDVTGLDYEYGETRDYHKYGGCSLVAETLEDVKKITAYIDFNRHPCDTNIYLKEDTERRGIFVSGKEAALGILYVFPRRLTQPGAKKTVANVLF